MFPPKTLHANSHLDEFLGRSGSPPPTLPRLEFLPMFPRTERPGGNQTFDTLKPVHPSIPKGLSDLQSMLPEANTVDDEYNDLHKQHMIVVDGWRKLSVFIMRAVPRLSLEQKPSLHPLPQASAPHPLVLAQVMSMNSF